MTAVSNDMHADYETKKQKNPHGMFEPGRLGLGAEGFEPRRIAESLAPLMPPASG